MKTRLFFLNITLFLSYSLIIYSQQDIQISRDSLFKIIGIKFNDTNFRKLDNNKIIWTYTDSMTISKKESGLRGRKQLHTISITLRFEGAWDSLRINNTKNKNVEILKPISEKFIHYMDSIKWKGVKTNINSFNNNKVEQLRSGMYKTSESERELLNQLVNYPDFLFMNYGIFLESNPDSFQYIVEKNVISIFLNKLENISKDIFNLTTIKNGKKQFE